MPRRGLALDARVKAVAAQLLRAMLTILPTKVDESANKPFADVGRRDDERGSVLTICPSYKS